MDQELGELKVVVAYACVCLCVFMCVCTCVHIYVCVVCMSCVWMHRGIYVLNYVYLHCTDSIGCN